MTDLPQPLAVPLRKAADVIPHLGSPLHWRQGRSAKALAESWFDATGLPDRIAAMLCQVPEYSKAELLNAWLERETDLLDAQPRHSQTDLLALIGAGTELVVLAVEGKVDEPFGSTVATRWGAAGQRTIKTERLDELCKTLGLNPANVDELRYQLLHRTVATILEARRFRTKQAILLVQSFCPNESGFADFQAFATALQYQPIGPDVLSEPREIEGIQLRLGWVRDTIPEGKDPPTVQWLTDFGRTRLSKSFFMRDFLCSEIAAIHALSNIPQDPDLAIAAGKRLCSELLEPLQDKFGPIAIRSAYRSPEVNGLGAKMQSRGAKGYNCASNERNAAAHIWDQLDETGAMGATACVVIPSVYDLFCHEEGGWQNLAWWIHDHLPYSTLTFYPRYWAFNIQWHERPRRLIKSHVAPVGTLTEPGRANHSGDHSNEWRLLDQTFAEGHALRPEAGR